jgi:hypothetical protein
MERRDCSSSAKQIAAARIHNMKLSQARAQAIRDAALADGLSADRIDVQSVGESRPPVPTQDGVKEAQSRGRDRHGIAANAGRGSCRGRMIRATNNQFKEV